MPLPIKLYKSPRYKIYEFNDQDWYVKYLHSFDANIHLPDNVAYVKTVKYVGNLSSENLVIAPLSSDKNKFYLDADPNRIDIEKIKTPGTTDHESHYLGVLRIKNQIPIPDRVILSEVKFYDLAKRDRQYADLLILEINSLNSNRDDINEKSFACSKERSFKNLKRAAKVYDDTNNLVQERIQAYPKTFSDKENEEFFKKTESNEADKNNQSSCQGVLL